MSTYGRRDWGIAGLLQPQPLADRVDLKEDGLPVRRDRQIICAELQAQPTIHLA